MCPAVEQGSQHQCWSSPDRLGLGSPARCPTPHPRDLALADRWGWQGLGLAQVCTAGPG